MLSLFLLSLKRVAMGAALGSACLTAALPALASEVQGKYLATAAQANPPFPFLQGANLTQADGAWQFYQQNMGALMSAWAQTEIKQPAGTTLFYPFSGPDFVTAAHLFPQASRFVMVAMQAAGEPAALSSMGGARAQNFQAKFCVSG